MQPEPTKILTQPLNTLTSERSINTPQHGSQLPDLYTTDPPNEPRGETAQSSSTGPTVALSSREGEGIEEHPQRLSAPDTRDPLLKPKVQRISEYENALAPVSPKNLTEGPGFKVIKKRGTNHGGPQLQNFPNGNKPHDFYFVRPH
jgi:hypothetical protein